MNSLNGSQFINQKRRVTHGTNANDKIYQLAYNKLKSLRKNTLNG